jgi:hypothetical protein
LAHRLGYPEVDHLGHRAPVVLGHQDVGRLQVPVDDPLLVGVLNRLAHLDEQPEPVADTQAAPIAVVGDRDTADQLHDEVWMTLVGHSGVKHFGDVRVVHEGEGLPLGLEPGDHLVRVHSRLDQLEGYLPADWVVLLGDEYHPHPAFADQFHEPVRPDDCSGTLRGAEIGRPVQVRGRVVEKGPGPHVGGHQPLHLCA